MAGVVRQGRGQRIQLVALAATAVVSWSLAIALRIEPVRAALLTPLGLADPATAPSAEPAPATSSPSTTAATSTATATNATPSPTVSATETTATAALEPNATASGATSDAPPAEGSASAASDALAREPLDPVTACVGSLLPPGSFDRGRPNVAFVCKERYPRKAVTQLQAQISLGQWGTDKATEGMREWAMLEWYDLAALSVFRGYCCDEPRTLLWTFRVVCPLNRAMGRIEAAVGRGDNVGLQTALVEYTQSAVCLTKQGQGPNFSQSEMPGPGLAALQKMLDRRQKGTRRP